MLFFYENHIRGSRNKNILLHDSIIKLFFRLILVEYPLLLIFVVFLNLFYIIYLNIAIGCHIYCGDGGQGDS